MFYFSFVTILFQKFHKTSNNQNKKNENEILNKLIQSISKFKLL